MLTLSTILFNKITRPVVSAISSSQNLSTSSDKMNHDEEADEDLSTVMFVLGGPGAGKGTQCTNLVKEYGFEHLSAGDLLRAERNSGSKDGELIQHYIKEGKIVPVEITIRLLERAMNDSPKSKFLIDGFPRNKDNLDGWNKLMTGKVNVMGVLFFNCPEDVCVKRIMKRSETSGRADDNEESLRKRFRTYYNETMPIIDSFKANGLVMNVDATPTPDQVFESVKKLLDNSFQSTNRRFGN
ncbi:UMP-CMP kinase-like [Clytia hemisphaerica]|uniref:UMP-CMP kinase n=1 Tax=Clytia hemisphaerica TaxID=252671 RepID=A0A7M5V735_9CNID